MPALRYTREELLRSHDWTREHRVAGHRLHGGFDARDAYVPPRALVRGPAIDAWSAALRDRGGDLLAADASLLSGERGTNPAQQKLLLLEGLGQTFWNLLTITGEIEARGRLLAELQLPPFAEAVFEDVSDLAIGHLNGGLLEAHGLDEGGQPAEPERSEGDERARGERSEPIGGHDVMWFALRDLAFGSVGHPRPDVPARIGRPDEEATLVPEIATRFERSIAFLMNLLLIEFRAELNFRFTEDLLRDPELFADRRAEALEAAEVVGRIRTDEAIHVDSLRLYLGELASLTFRTRDAGRLPGRTVIDRLWSGIVHWWTVEQPPLAAAQQRAVMRARILAHRDGRRILARFEALAD
jgi:hypothetical protein